MNRQLVSGPPLFGPRRIGRNLLIADPLSPALSRGRLSPEAFLNRLDMPLRRRGDGYSYRLPLSGTSSRSITVGSLHIGSLVSAFDLGRRARKRS